MLKYLAIFKNSFSEVTSYRLNFLLGRLRYIIVLILLYGLYTALTGHGRSLGTYTQEEFITYICIIHLLRSFLFGVQNRKISGEINDGTLSSILIRPLRYMGFAYARELAERCVLLFTSIFELGVFLLLTGARIMPPQSITHLLFFLISVILAHILYTLLTYLISFFAFWSREAGGPRFMFDWFLEFASGAYFPLSILPTAFFTFLQFLPFVHLVYSPIQIYLGKIQHFEEIFLLLFIQLVWIILTSFAVSITWKKGLKKYSAEGI